MQRTKECWRWVCHPGKYDEYDLQKRPLAEEVDALLAAMQCDLESEGSLVRELGWILDDCPEDELKDGAAVVRETFVTALVHDCTELAASASRNPQCVTLAERVLDAIFSAVRRVSSVASLEPCE